jgi:RNA polymerase sigma factor (sigma-70 family)
MKEKWNEFIKGNNLALASMYETLFQPLLFISIKYTHDLDISRDLISELFTSLLETSIDDRVTKWQEVREIKAFLTIIIRNKSIDAIRTKTNRDKLANDWIKNQATKTEIEFINEEYNDQCISLLNDDEKKLILLHLEGYKNQEIGKKFNYSEKTVRNKLSLSRKKLVYIWKNLIILMIWKILN